MGLRHLKRIALPAALCGAALLPGAAFAHTHVTLTSPAGGATVVEAPKRVSIDFNQPVDLRGATLHVFDEYGKRVDGGAIFRPGGHSRSVGVRLRSGLGGGAYSAAYRVVAADGHPVAGWFGFGVAAAGRSVSPQPAAAPPPAVRADLEASASPVVEALHALARVLNDAALLLIVGALAFRAFVWHRDADPGRWPGRLLMGAAVTGIVAAFAGIPLEGALTAGAGLSSVVDPGVLGDAFASRAGQAWAVRLVAWEVLVLLLMRTPGVPSRAGTVSIGLPAALIAASVPWGGHAGATDPGAVLIAADLVHVVGAGAWLGTLVLLLVAFWPGRRAPDEESVAATRRFSSVALAAMASLLAAGALQAWVYLGSPAALVQGAYGMVLMFKAALLAVIAVLAVRNRRRVSRLPAFASALALRRAMRAEVALAVLVLAATAILVRAAPPA